MTGLKILLNSIYQFGASNRGHRESLSVSSVIDNQNMHTLKVSLLQFKAKVAQVMNDAEALRDEKAIKKEKIAQRNEKIKKIGRKLTEEKRQMKQKLEQEMKTKGEVERKLNKEMEKNREIQQKLEQEIEKKVKVDEELDVVKKKMNKLVLQSLGQCMKLKKWEESTDEFLKKLVSRSME